MDFTKLDDLLNTWFSKEKKKKISKEEQIIYVNEVKDLLSNNQFDDSILHYIIAAPQNVGFKGYLEWYHSASYEQQINSMEIILNCKSMQNVQANRRFRIVLFLLSNVISAKEVNKGVVSQLMAWLDELSYNKDGSRTNDLGKAFKTCFFNIFRKDAVFPMINSLGFTDEYEKKLICLFEEALSATEIKGTDDVMRSQILKNWIRMNKPDDANSEVVNDATIKDQTKEGTPTEQQGNSECYRKLNDKSFNMGSNEGTQINSITGQTASKLVELAQIVNVIENTTIELRKETKTKDKKISSLYVQLKDSIDAMHTLENENAELRNQLSTQQEQLRLLQIQNEELSARVERQVSVLDVFQEDKANAQTEQLNSLASSLIRQYKEFKVAKEMELSTDLELTLLDLVEDIFRKLEKNGVDIKGRL